MGLYDRNYSSQQGKSTEYGRVEGFVDSDSKIKFVKKTYHLLGASMLAAAAGAYATMPIRIQA